MIHFPYCNGMLRKKIRPNVKEISLGLKFGDFKLLKILQPWLHFFFVLYLLFISYIIFFLPINILKLFDI